MPARLLVADDEADIRTLVRVRLRRFDVEVVEAADGTSALRLVEEHALPDVAVLDQRMPGHTGLEVAAVLRGRRADLPITIFSAFLDAGLVRRAEALGVATCAKSNLAALGAWVERHVGGPTVRG